MIFPPSKKVRWLVDCDSYYASCEIMRNPRLRGRPVAVAREGDIVLAASYEAKAHGIKTGTATRDAKRILPATIFIEPDFHRYALVSEKLNEYLRLICPTVEVFSIDESFIEITWLDKQRKCSYKQVAERLRVTIKQDIGIPVSVWVGPTRLLAKIFSDLNKPFGEYVALSSESISTTLKQLSLQEIPFIGSQRGSRLSAFCTTAYDFQQLSYEVVKREMGRHGLKIRLELNSVNATELGNKEIPKWISRTKSFHPHFTSDKQLLKTYLIINMESAYARLLDAHRKVRYLKVHLRDKQFRRYGIDYRLPQPTDERNILFPLVIQLFEKLYIPNKQYRTTGVYFWELEDGRYRQQSIFDAENNTEQSKKLQNLIHRMRKKFGRHVIGTGRLAQRKNITIANRSWISVG